MLKRPLKTKKVKRKLEVWRQAKPNRPPLQLTYLKGRPDEPPRQAVLKATAYAMTARMISTLNDVDEYERNCKSLAHCANPTGVAHPG